MKKFKVKKGKVGGFGGRTHKIGSTVSESDFLPRNIPVLVEHGYLEPLTDKEAAKEADATKEADTAAKAADKAKKLAAKEAKEAKAAKEDEAVAIAAAKEAEDEKAEDADDEPLV